MTDHPAIRIENVCIMFGDEPESAMALADEGMSRADIQERTGQVLGVHDCSLDIAEGEILVLMGLSGSGKSTLLRAINRLNPITRGEVTIWCGGEPRQVGAAGEKSLREIRSSHVSMVFQQFALLPWRSVAGNVSLVLEDHRLDRAARTAIVDDVLARTRLADFRDALPKQLSGGMRQRVAIAIALANDPEVLVADEATTALDVTVQAQVLALLHRLTEDRGTALLFISHDLALVGALCDRIAVLYAGQVVEEGPAAAMLAAPAHPYTAKLLDCLPRRGGGPAPIAGLPPASDSLPPGCAFAPRCPRVQPACSAGQVAMAPVAPARRARCLFPLAGKTA